jgi:hypothetical protein
VGRGHLHLLAGVLAQPQLDGCVGRGHADPPGLEQHAAAPGGGALVQAAVGQCHGPLALRQPAHPGLSHAQHELRPEDSDISPALERPPVIEQRHAGGGKR